MTLRLYDEKKDKKSVQRIWRECGWLGKDKNELKAMDIFISTSKPWVAELNGEAECFVITTKGTIQHLNDAVPLCAVTTVTTSRIARRQGLARRLTAAALAEAATEGAMMAGLGIFDQGFYNQLGFGNGSYEHWISFDPSTLKIKQQPRVPHRLTVSDWMAMHTCRLHRLMTHGNCNLLPAEITRSEMMWTENGFGLGYFDGPGESLSHYFWAKARDEHGPYSIVWIVYQTYPQLMELLALIKQWGDQVHLVHMDEPPGIQMQDLIDQPFRHRLISKDSKYENRMSASAYWQLRMLDIQGCLEHTHLRSGRVSFNLQLTDPIEKYLDTSTSWKGLTGTYVITLGETSSAKAGFDAALPTLNASVGAFTRLWMGILPATSLSLTDELAGSPHLLDALDWALCLPTPFLAWDY
jgi:GNAT superfamily N-acetyltransferase